MSWNWVDVIFFCVFAFLLFRGWQMGFIRTFFNYISLIAGVAITLEFWKGGAQLVQNTFPTWPKFTYPVISIALIFLISVLLIQATGYFISKFFRPTPLGPLDRILGISFGMIKSAIVLLFVGTLLSFFPKNQSWISPFQKSVLISHSSQFIPTLKSWMKMDRLESKSSPKATALNLK